MPIKKVLNGDNGGKPVKIWTEDVEPEAETQLLNIASLPFIFKHVAVMPDVHFGIGATVGSVVAAKGAVMPAAVGVDIGCGMAAVKVKGVKADHLGDNLKDLRHSIERSVPVGFNEHREGETNLSMWSTWGNLHTKCQGLKSKAQRQLGTLGGGNHFVEVCLDTENNVWIMLHSGSRNIGKSLAEAHIDTAKGLMRKMFISLPDPNLAYFAMDTPEFKAYMNDLLWAQEYAMWNRQAMLKLVLKDLRYYLGLESLEADIEINCHHNFAVMESHFGENVLVTRKGAVRARAGDMGIIPGSMGTRSYIVRGLGNPESFHSCSHGAGRRMSRKKARETFTEADMVFQTQGVECRKDSEVIDEIPGAYKLIEDVIANQSDLVEVVAELKQVLCVKG